MQKEIEWIIKKFNIPLREIERYITIDFINKIKKDRYRIGRVMRSFNIEDEIIHFGYIFFFRKYPQYNDKGKWNGKFDGYYFFLDKDKQHYIEGYNLKIDFVEIKKNKKIWKERN